MVMPPPAVTLTFNLLTPKSYQHIYEPKCICDQNLVKFPSLVFEIWRYIGFRDIACCDLDLLTPKCNQHIYDPNYVCDQNLVKFPSLVFEIWCSQGGTHRLALTHSLTHSLTHARHSRTSVTDGQTRSQYASGTVFQRLRRHKK